jgi:hypothetical protein
MAIDRRAYDFPGSVGRPGTAYLPFLSVMNRSPSAISPTRSFPALPLLVSLVVACSPAPVEQEPSEARPAATTPTASRIHVVQVEATASSAVPLEAAAPEPRARQGKAKPSTERVHTAHAQTAPALPKARSAGGGGAGSAIVGVQREFAYWDGCRMANSLSLMQYCNP